MKNIKNKSSRILLVLIIFMLQFIFSDILIGQDFKDLYIELQSKEINGNNFNGYLNLNIKNISTDTIYIIMQPFNYDIIGKSEGISVYVSIYNNEFSPNRINFFNKSKKYSSASGGSPISFLQFPKILYLLPEKKVEISLRLNKEAIKELANYSWDITCDLWYGYKKEIDTTLSSKPEYLKREFEKSLFFKDNIKIDLVSNSQSLNSDSLIYFNTRLRNPAFYYEDTESIYDSIILKCFVQYLCDFIDKK